jgi:hypothetical protein
MLVHNQLPHQLKLLLANKHILKVGRNPNADLSYLQQACRSPIPFVGGVDLAKMAKERQIISNARSCSLSDLVAITLHRQLPKNVAERVSQVWEHSTLSDSACQYAVLDALASKMIYEKLIHIPVPGPLPPHPEPETDVFVFHTDRTRVIATGIVVPHPPGSSIDGINISPTRIVVHVQKVLVPGAIISQHHKRSLESFGQLPFDIVCLRSHLRLATMPLHVDLHPQPTPSPVSVDNTVETSISHLEEPLSDTSDEGIGTLLMDASLAEEAGDGPSVSSTHLPDAQSLSEGQAVLDDAISQATFPKIRSRVLKDVFHVFNMLYISRTHGLCVAFSRALRDAIFIPDKDDKQRIIVWGSLQNPPKTWAQILTQTPAWLWRHCKRVIPPPELLHPLVTDVFRVYGPLKDAKTSLPLFNSAAWGVAKNILDLIAKGFVSDPPGIALYSQIGVDAKAGGLPIYRCMRGTNMTEGGVHTHLRSRLPTSGVSIHHLLACLNDFILRHNLLV